MKKGDQEKDTREIIPVKNVLQEYEIIRRRRCRCGGELTAGGQSLHRAPNGEFYDRITVGCSLCGATSEILFDINSFFPCLGRA